MSSTESVPARASIPRTRTLTTATTLLAAIAGAAVAIGSASTAAADEAPRAIAVRLGDLNLESDRGLHTMYMRLSAAAHAVCGYADLRQLRLAEQAQQCYRLALDQAVASVRNARLSALNAARGGRSAT
jgi:UrcA family protein